MSLKSLFSALRNEEAAERADETLRPICPKCRMARMSLMHDQTGMYFKCSECKHEEPPRRKM